MLLIKMPGLSISLQNFVWTWKLERNANIVVAMWTEVEAIQWYNACVSYSSKGTSTR